MIEVHVAGQFSPYLGGRYQKDGPGSGQAFREELLLPALQRALAVNDTVVVNLDGVAGTPTSFLEEAFGGIFRARPAWTLQEVQRALKIQAPTTPRLTPFIALAQEYMQAAAQRRN